MLSEDRSTDIPITSIAHNEQLRSVGIDLLCLAALQRAGIENPDEVLELPATLSISGSLDSPQTIRILIDNFGEPLSIPFETALTERQQEALSDVFTGNSGELSQYEMGGLDRKYAT
jgi:hypothetical protein